MTLVDRVKALRAQANWTWIPMILTSLIAFWYVGEILDMCLKQAWRPYVAETDWKQAVWQYWRYTDERLFPAGHLLTDYAFLMHAPPFWWGLMASLSSFMPPTDAANVLNWIGIVGTSVFAYLAVARASNHYVGIVAACMVERYSQIWAITAGGYARTFGPLLVCAFLAAWIWKKERLVAVVLIVQAGLYPSVVVPCGFAWGVFIMGRFVLDRAWQKGREGIQPVVELFITGGLVILLGQIAELRVPEWWGHVISLEDAMKMPEVQPGGRAQWYPMVSVKNALLSGLESSLRVQGKPWWTGLSQWNGQNHMAVYGIVALVAVAIHIWRKQKFPLAIPLLVVGSLVGFWLARTLAFTLYLPHRVPHHTLPSIVVLTVAILVGRSFTAFLPRVGQALGALFLGVLVLGVSGDGLDERTKYRSYDGNARLYQWIEKNTPVDAQFAGNLQILDEVPLFAKRQVFVNWKLAHPFRKGYYAEIERRIKTMYEALYATNLDDILAFCEKEDIDYWIFHTERMKSLERGDSNLYEPLRSKFGKPLFQKNEPLGFVFKTPPPEAVVFKHKSYVVISVEKLKQAKANGWQKPAPAAPAPPATPGAPAGASTTPAAPTGAPTAAPQTTAPAPASKPAPAPAPAPEPAEEAVPVEREGDEG